MLSIIIPHYQTEEHIRLCLRSLRQYSREPLEVIVVDNNSQDASVEYLQRLKWITLIINPTQAIGSRAHAEALELGVQQAQGDWLVFFHSDTIVLKPGWDSDLLQKIQDRQAVGLSTTVRDVNRFEPVTEKWKRAIYAWRNACKDFFKTGQHNKKIMSFCFIIKKQVFQDTGYSFRDPVGDFITDLYYREIQSRYPFLLLTHAELAPMLWHTSNVTAILTGQITKQQLYEKFQQKNSMLMSRPEIQNILNNDSLDN
ncbi:glycosyltransferase family 2 protein [Desulfobacca acetoxidans]